VAWVFSKPRDAARKYPRQDPLSSSEREKRQEKFFTTPLEICQKMLHTLYRAFIHKEVA